MAKLTLIRGLPGSGKTTYAKEHYPNVLHLENDMFHYRNGKYCFDATKQRNAIEWCIKTTERALELGMDVCVSNTFTRRNFIISYKTLASLFGADFEVIRMTNDYGNIHDVPESVMRSMKASFEDWDGEKIVG